MAGWQSIAPKDSCVIAPLSAMSAQIQGEIRSHNTGGYTIHIANAMEQEHPENRGHAMLPDCLGYQSPHRFCVVITDFTDNSRTLGEEIAYNRALAQQDLEELKTKNATPEEIAETLTYLEGLESFATVTAKGEPTDDIAEVRALIPDDLIENGRIATGKNVTYRSYSHPLGLRLSEFS